MSEYSDSTTSGKITASLWLRLFLVLSLLLSGLVWVRPARAQWRSLTGLLPGYTLVSPIAFSPDSNYVVYIADVDVDDQYQLYSVPVTGNAATRLNPPLAANGNVNGMSITADSSYVIYLADQEVDERRELYRVPIGGGESVKISPPLAASASILSFKYNADTGRIFYKADQDLDEVFELYSVPVTGGAVIKHNPDFAADGGIHLYDIDPVGGRVVYIGRPDGSSMYELYSSPVLGGMSIKLNQPLAVGLQSFQIAPGYDYVMYLAMEASGTQIELFGNNTTGGTPHRRNFSLNPGENVVGFRISPTGFHVVYNVGTGGSFLRGALWRAFTFGGASQRLTDIPDDRYGVIGSDFLFSPDGNRVVFLYQQNIDSLPKLQSASLLDGPSDLQTLFMPEADNRVGRVIVSPNSQWVAFDEYTVSVRSMEVRSVPIAGGSPQLLGNGELMNFTPDSQRVIYRTDPPSAANTTDIMSVQVSGGDERNLSRLGANSFASIPLISLNGAWVVFGAAIDSSTAYELRISDGVDPLDVTPTPTATLTPGAPTATPTATPSGTPPPGATPDNFIYLNLLHK